MEQALIKVCVCRRSIIIIAFGTALENQCDWIQQNYRQNIFYHVLIDTPHFSLFIGKCSYVGRNDYNKAPLSVFILKLEHWSFEI